jgi:hypothetical protein
MNDTIYRVLTRAPSSHTNEDRLLAGISTHNRSETFGNALGQFRPSVDHQQTDLSFAEHPRQI